MNKIEFPRVGVDGVKYSQSDIERKYMSGRWVRNVSRRLRDIPPTGKAYLDKAIAFMANNPAYYLLASPQKLERIVRFVDKVFPDDFAYINNKGVWASTQVGSDILNALNYSTYRSTKLTKIAKCINVKACPYCNMHYTLYSDDKSKPLAKFQFDHFYDKCKYPMLSMSLYNLIPSCAVCNHGKSNVSLPIDFNPYYSSIADKFHFELHDPVGLYGAKKVADEVDVDIVAEPGVSINDVKKFNDTFHLKALYSRHGDVAQEVFDKAYEYPYYNNPSNFGFLSKYGPDYLKRLWMGTYPDSNDIEKRPMTKFIQDLWKQAGIVSEEMDDFVE